MTKDLHPRSSLLISGESHMMPKTHPSIIAIDGPAASGKSTLGRRLAEALGYLFLDTGVMYRAVTWVVLRRGVDVLDEPAVTAVAEQASIDVRPAFPGRWPYVRRPRGRAGHYLETRGPDVEANVSIVAAYRGVRRAMSDQQRRIGKRGRVVMVGRDIGTVVLPDADLKIYLDASIPERARRRHQEDLKHGAASDYEQTLKAVTERDRIDSTRDIAPLRAASDAVILDFRQAHRRRGL